jgi:protein-S-isoprenylcysteine O-methyltransferase Ste14
VHWVLRHLGPNVSETVLTKARQDLVTSGPYGHVRHPLYATGVVLFVSLGLMAGNWFILLFALVALLAVRLVVIPLEEGALLATFGADYRSYRQRTGALWPRLPGGAGRT